MLLNVKSKPNKNSKMWKVEHKVKENFHNVETRLQNVHNNLPQAPFEFDVERIDHM